MPDGGIGERQERVSYMNADKSTLPRSIKQFLIGLGEGVLQKERSSKNTPLSHKEHSWIGRARNGLTQTKPDFGNQALHLPSSGHRGTF